MKGEKMYNKLIPKTIQKLKKIVGETNVLLDEVDRDAFSHDETSGLKHLPDIIVRPRTPEEIIKILSIANKEKIPVTPRGGGTGLSGGAVPIYGGIVLSTQNMNKILEIDKDNLMAVVEPGVITGELQKEVEKYGLFYPINPASLDSCTIGGNVAEVAGGANTVKYGTTRNYVCGLEAVLPAGELIKMGGKLVKNATGYGLMYLLIGSEGTLAVITKVVLRLIPLPKEKVNLLFPFDNLISCSNAIRQIIKSKITPTALDFMDRRCIKACEQFLKRELPFNQAGIHLLIELDGNKKDDLEEEYIKIGEICSENGALDALIAEDRPTQERLWEARKNVREALMFISPVIDEEDIVVPRDELTRLLEGIEKISQKYSLPISNYGHPGDGNVHVNILKKDVDNKIWREIIPKMVEDIFKLTVSLGGMISGEHGIGLAKKKYLPLAVGNIQIELMRKIKKIVDPNNILNPGKIFELSYKRNG
jgi:glycolate oxidase